jgi:hypothetical protein
MTVSAYDPDEEEGAPVAKRPAWQTKYSETAGKALKACGRKYFKDRNERKTWNLIEEKMSGENDEDYLYRCWVLDRIARTVKNNAHGITRSFTNLMAQVNNDDWRVDWITKNRTRLLKERQTIGKQTLTKSLLSFSEEEPPKES